MSQLPNLFSQLVYDLVARIPEGRVITYGRIARSIGYPNNARRVGNAMRHTPDDLFLPTWRVVNAEGRTAPGWDDQRRLLELEGVPFNEKGRVDLNHCLWSPDEDDNR